MSSDLPVVVPRAGSSDKQTLLASFFLGLVVNYLLWGIQITQSYNYYKFYRKTDNKWLKTAVGVLFISEAVQSIGVSSWSWSFLVESTGDLPPPLQSIGWGGWMIPLLNGFTASLVHVFYAHKIWTLLTEPSKYICTSIVLILSAVQFTGAFGCTVFMSVVQLSLPEFNRIKTWAVVWLVTSALNDIVITLIMSWKLSSSRTGFQRTDNILSKLIRLTVETGLATAVVQLANIIIYLIWPLKPYHVALVFLDPKVYSNSMLALLNSRQPRVDNGWERQDKSHGQVDSIHIRTTKTVDVTSDYELGERDGTSKLGSFHPVQPYTMKRGV